MSHEKGPSCWHLDSAGALHRRWPGLSMPLGRSVGAREQPNKGQVEEQGGKRIKGHRESDGLGTPEVRQHRDKTTQRSDT